MASLARRLSVLKPRPSPVVAHCSLFFPGPPSHLEMDLNWQILLLLLLLPLAVAESSCGTEDLEFFALAFRSVFGFRQPPLSSNDDATCNKTEIEEIKLSSRNLTGTVSWMFLHNISALRVLDLSNNFIQGSIPGGFWSAPALVEVNLSSNRLGGALRFEPSSHFSHPSLQVLNLSSNRFTNAVGLSNITGLEVLDLSRNELGSVPPGLKGSHGLKYLDLSHNSMIGNFPGDLPLMEGLRFLNISYNNFTGRVNSQLLERFGRSAFIKAGSLIFSSSARATGSSPTHKERDKASRKQRALKTGLIVAASVIVGLALFGVLLYISMRRRKGWAGGKEEKAEPGATALHEAAWVAEARPTSPVVVFEKPLMELMFADLVAATSGFGRDSQLAEGGRNGPVYRAVLPGELHVVVRVLDNARDWDEREAVATFREVTRLRHPNLLPLLGYCIAGKQKMLLYEYMERGDLHRWLHELPVGETDVEDWSADTWEHPHVEQRRTAVAAVGDWPTRHRIALGVARGLAFLHQGWVGSRRSVVHGHLVPSNILLGEDLNPRISDFASGAVSRGTAEGDVYDYGVVVMELVTGRADWTEETAEWVRGMVRVGRAAEAVEPRLRAGDGGGAEWDREMAETLRVGYLCTAQSPEKRPTMQQVVGLLKDIRPTERNSVCPSSSSS